VLVWTWLRLPETLSPVDRRRFSFRQITEGLGLVLADRQAVAYGLAAMLLLGALYGFISSAQPVFGEAYGLNALFALAMGATAVVQSASAFLCSRLLRRIGAASVVGMALWAYVGFAAALVLALTLNAVPFALFFGLFTAMMAMFTWGDATLGALSMANLGKVAGTAASAFGALQALGATVLGTLIGQAYDGTPRALVWGSLLLGLAALGCVQWARRQG